MGVFFYLILGIITVIYIGWRFNKDYNHFLVNRFIKK
jgi:hypothetical protein